MDHQNNDGDLDFLRSFHSKVGEQYWEKDEKGEKVILRSGWEEAQK